ncbi:MAG: hypothetical protein D6726_02690 [Nitrospirae bacterium]|nr:MAG: hypothetical protein D6726_02690 [Nitrospirota bacterium]
MDEERLIHDWMCKTLKERLSGEYREIKDNISARENEINGVYPDLILGNHGLVLAVCEVETEGSINQEKVEEWKKVVSGGTKLFLMIPKQSTKKVTSLLWEAGIMDKVSIGTYEIQIKMP